MIGNSALKQCQGFVYLGGTLSRMSRRNVWQGRWQKNRTCSRYSDNLCKIRTAQDNSKSTKVLLYQTLLRSIILHNCETWTLKKQHKRKLCVYWDDRTEKGLWNEREERLWTHWKNCRSPRILLKYCKLVDRHTSAIWPYWKWQIPNAVSQLYA